MTIINKLADYGMTQVKLPGGQRVQIYTDRVEHPIHSHIFNLHSRVLMGSLREEQYTDDGRTLTMIRYVHEGETYFIKAETMHRIVITSPPVITLVTELEKGQVPVRVVR